MRLAILTTETPHHVRFVQAIAERFPVARTYIESRGLQAPYASHHAFEDTRDDFERDHWFGGAARTLADYSETKTFPSLNNDTAIADLKALAPDLTVVFGTGKLGSGVIEACNSKILNLHGGDPEHYRGLDTHLWAIWHGDFAGLVTTLHHLNATLDDGDIVSKAPIALQHGMALHQLRAANTEICIELTVDALEQFAAAGTVATKPQAQKGRYYSFMPAELKEQCMRRFQTYTDKIK